MAETDLILDRLDTGIVVLDPIGRVEFWNNWMTSRSGLNFAAVVGRKLDRIFPELQGSRLMDAVSDALRQGMSSYISYAIHRQVLPLTQSQSSKSIPHDVIVKAIPAEGTAYRVLIHVRDVTANQQREIALQHVNDSLRNEIEQRKKAEAELKNREERLSAIVNIAFDAIIMADKNGNIIDANPIANSLFGYQGEEIIGLNVIGLTPFYYRDTVIKFTQEKFSANNEVICHAQKAQGLRKDGSIFPLELSLAFLPLGGESFFIGFCRDITKETEARAALQRSEERFRDFAESLGDWLWEMGPDLRFSFFSARMEEITGISPAFFLGRTRQEIAKEASAPQKWAKHMDDLENRRPFKNFEYRVYSPELGEYVYLRTNGKPIFGPDGVFSGYRGVGSNVTTEKKAEIELALAKEKAEAANKAKSQFLAMMSHELRTPMTAILGLADLLLDDALTEKQRQYLETLQSSAQVLLTVLNDVLDFSKIEAGEMRFEHIAFNLPKAINDTLALMQHSAGKKGVVLKEDLGGFLPNWVNGDPTRLRQIIFNLIGNAIKFTDNGGEITLGLRCRGIGDQINCEFWVKDTGCGMDEEQLKRIFRPFVQGDESTTRKFGGTGLGLAITKNLIENMGGRITVESKPNQGTIFSFFLVFGKEEDQSSEKFLPPLPEVPFSGNGLHILIADDDPTNRMLITLMLERLGHKADGAENGEIAVKMALAANYDGVFLDVQMPVMDGLSAAQLIRAEKGGDFPLIALTADVVSDNRQKYLESGFVGMIEKPINKKQMEEVLTAIQQRKEIIPEDTAFKSTGKLFNSEIIAELKEIMDKDEIDSLFNVFFNLSDQIIAELKVVVVAEDLLQAKKLAHKLKGSARNLGAEQVEAITRFLEVEAKDLKEFAAHLPILERICQDTCKIMRQL